MAIPVVNSTLALDLQSPPPLGRDGLFRVPAGSLKLLSVQSQPAWGVLLAPFKPDMDWEQVYTL